MPTDSILSNRIYLNRIIIDPGPGKGSKGEGEIGQGRYIPLGLLRRGRQKIWKKLDATAGLVWLVDRVVDLGSAFLVFRDAPATSRID